MKLFMILIILFSFQLKAEKLCPVDSDVTKMYAVFFNIAYKPDGVDLDAFKVNYPDEKQSDIAWSCLIKAASLGSCDALKVIPLYYEFGVGESLGVKKDIEASKKYKNLYQNLCKKKT
jgi:hypothetical protein